MVQLNPVVRGYGPTAGVSSGDMARWGQGRCGSAIANERYKLRGNRAVQPG
jgi:hypothetical protein